ncbi:hypothetical protein N3K61_20925 [Escherichia coli]|uniref:hypothetical protein n=1 Tax=Escherichia coli TaxID=562 RepID=UPI0021BEBF97|nr:hypothetical protein [Escherichia coli]MCT9836866.1 hypothetical protein [Escherichia coli]
MGKHHWKVEKQPEWYVKAVRKTIATLPGGYAEAADWLDVTENALFNRLRADGDQICSAIEDGVVEPHEQTAINDELYLSISKLQEHAALVYKIFCAPEKSNARECAAPGVVASIASGCGETNA